VRAFLEEKPMKIEQALRTANQADMHNPLLCEQCCRMLVIPKHRWLADIQEHLHVFGEIIFAIGKCFAALYLGIEYLVEAVFPHLNRKKDPYELEYERDQQEWEAKREADSQRILNKRIVDEANEDAAYLNSLKVRFAHAPDAYEDEFLTEQTNKLVAQRDEDPANLEKDRITLRKYAVDLEQLRKHEMRQNQRRESLKDEFNYHEAEMKRWSDRAHAAYDSKEKRLCEREMEVHKYKAQYAKIAHENI
jgi:hypothetical protein